MKNSLSIIVIVFTLFTSCTGVKTASMGLENEAFLEFIGNPKNYIGGIEINIDGTTTFVAEVNEDHTDRPKGKVYAISTGKHVVSITYNNNIIFKKQIFVSSQESKKIVLP